MSESESKTCGSQLNYGRWDIPYVCHLPAGHKLPHDGGDAVWTSPGVAIPRWTEDTRGER